MRDEELVRFLEELDLAYRRQMRKATMRRAAGWLLTLLFSLALVVLAVLLGAV